MNKVKITFKQITLFDVISHLHFLAMTIWTYFSTKKKWNYFYL